MHTALVTPNKPLRNDAGFTLLEILVAIVIFSIGLLGIASLQMNGMRFTQDSQLRAIATAQAEAITDRMRANSAGMIDKKYNITTGSIPASFPTDCSSANCSSDDLAIYDLVTWNATTTDVTQPKTSNADVLPNGSGVVCIDSTPNDGTPAAWACDGLGTIYAIKVTWTERTVGRNDRDIVTNDQDTIVQRLVMRVIP